MATCMVNTLEMAWRARVPPFNLLLEGLGCLQLIGLSINPGRVVNCNLLEGPTKLLMVVANCFGNSR